MEYLTLIIGVLLLIMMAAMLLSARRATDNAELRGKIDALENELKLIESVLSSRLTEMGNRIDVHLGRSGSLLGDVREKLGRLEETTRSIQEIAADISELQDVLKPPSVRGAIGETLLERLLSDVLPSRFYRLQFKLPSGVRVDAAIFLKGRIIPVDAKFPLNNFRKMVTVQGAERERFRKAFLADVRRRIDEIASKYVRPDAGTLNFAIMYIPAEGVYYEAFINSPETYEYALSRKVIPTSPGTFYMYLQTLLFGLRGMELERRIERVLAELSALLNTMGEISKDIDTLGEHLRRSTNKHESIKKSFDDAFSRLKRLSKGGETDEKVH